MGFPIKTCVQCGEEFELRPDKPGFANRCRDCTEEDAASAAKAGAAVDADQRRQQAAMDEARRSAIRDLLYRKDS